MGVAISVGERVVVLEDELKEVFVRSSGPGGQKVNTSATAVQLRFDAASSPGIPDDVLERLSALAGSLMTEDGIIVIDGRRFRSLERNRRDVRRRLEELLRRASRKPRRRRRTRPTRASVEKRLREKRILSRKKKRRRKPDPGEE